AESHVHRCIVLLSHPVVYFLPRLLHFLDMVYIILLQLTSVMVAVDVEKVVPVGNAGMIDFLICVGCTDCSCENDGQCSKCHGPSSALFVAATITRPANWMGGTSHSQTANSSAIQTDSPSRIYTGTMLSTYVFKGTRRRLERYWAISTAWKNTSM